jgi:pimeloyl-ACP methyl ester carboxylesterase
MSVAEVTMHRDGIWLTAMSRPVGELAGRTIERFVDDLVALAQKANIVVVNLVAASVPTPAALARALRRPSAMLSGPNQALLLVGADDHLLRELERIGGDIATVPVKPES